MTILVSAVHLTSDAALQICIHKRGERKITTSADGPMELDIINGETNQREKRQILPSNGKIGVSTLAVAVD